MKDRNNLKEDSIETWAHNIVVTALPISIRKNSHCCLGLYRWWDRVVRLYRCINAAAHVASSSIFLAARSSPWRTKWNASLFPPESCVISPPPREPLELGFHSCVIPAVSAKPAILITVQFCSFCPVRAPSGVARIDPLRFLAGRRKRQLNQALPVLPRLFSVSVVLLTRAPYCVVLFCVMWVFCLLVVLVRLSVPVQVIDWKDSSPKWPIMSRWGR